MSFYKKNPFLEIIETPDGQGSNCDRCQPPLGLLWLHGVIIQPTASTRGRSRPRMESWSSTARWAFSASLTIFWYGNVILTSFIARAVYRCWKGWASLKGIIERHHWGASLRGIFEGHLWGASLRGISEGHLSGGSLRGIFEGHLWKASLKGIIEGHLQKRYFGRAVFPWARWGWGDERGSLWRGGGARRAGLFLMPYVWQFQP